MSARAGIALAALGVVVACGDNRQVTQRFESVSGSRLALEAWLFDDGTRQIDPSAFYDTRLHTRCVAQTWTDGVLRCVPVATMAVYGDAECTTALGVTPAMSSAEPTHFIGYELVENESIAMRVHRAGARTVAIAEYYERRDGQCVGPLPSPPDVDYYAITGELAPAEMVAFTDEELGAGRLGLQVRSSEDGMHVALGVRDRELDLSCAPAAHGDRFACEPVDLATARMFEDSACTSPVVLAASEELPPAVAKVTDPAGCDSYRSVGAEVLPPLYRRDGDSCVRAPLLSGQRAFALGAEVALPALERVDDASGERDRRLQTIVLRDTGDVSLLFPSELLVDRAIRAECRRELVGDEVRCVPARSVPVSTLYAAGCTVSTSVALVTAQSCGAPAAFARGTSDEGTLVFHAVGDPAPTLYRFGAAGCEPYIPPVGTAIHALGPPLPAETFMRARRFGER